MLDWVSVFFQVFGGLGLFLMGMKIMSESLQRVAGKRLRRILEHLTSNRLMGVGVGVGITAIVQSSSLTTVMVVSLVEAGMMTLRQAIGVVLGANIGTTVTAWLVTFKIVEYGLPIIGVGALFRFFGRGKKWQYMGEIIFGLGALFLGMELMKLGVAPLKESEFFTGLFLMIDGSSYSSILLGIFVGTITTLVVQSSSATIGITIALASQGLIGFVGAVALVLGDNVGTTITAMLASIGAGFNAKRTALAHALFNILGVIWILLVFYFFVSFVDYAVPGSPDFTISSPEEAAAYGSEEGTRPFVGQHIAMAHTLFNVANVLLFIPLISVLVFLSERLIPEPKGGAKRAPFEVEPKFIDFSLANTSSVGLIMSQNELVEMSSYVDESISAVRSAIHDPKKARESYKIARKNEKLLTNYKNSIDKFLLRISEMELSEEEAQTVINHMSVAHCLDRMGYFSRRMAEVYRRMDSDGVQMSAEATKKLDAILSANVLLYKDSLKELKSGNGSPAFVSNLPGRVIKIKKMIRSAKLSHFDRVKKGICPEGAGIHYIDALNVLSNMKHQTRNLAEAMVSSGGPELVPEHEYSVVSAIGGVFEGVGKIGKKAKNTLKKPKNKAAKRKTAAKNPF
ncbi:MAG: Na/Pi cotransporter family protein [Candidatus Aenigmarchaeota archaeon]|nr:Na/Pi cotransporter family protein [Candidatus Aenigmarchaeota archaeon]